MNIDPSEVLSALQRAQGKGLSLKKLAGQLRLGRSEHQRLQRELAASIKGGTVSFDGHVYRAVRPARGEPPRTRPPEPERRRATVEEKRTPPSHDDRRPAARKQPAALLEAAQQHRKQAAERSNPARSGSAQGGPEAGGKPRRPGGEVVGILKLKSEGFGFVSPLLGDGKRENDLFIPPQHVPDGTLDGDVVRARAIRGRDGRLAGEILEVVERRRQLALGIYQSRGHAVFVIPHDRTLTQPISVQADPRAHDGDMVKVRLDRAPRKAGALAGEIVEVLGTRGGPKFEILATAYAEGFSDEFDAATRLAAQSVPEHVLAEEVRSRRDLRDLPLVTIDGEDARDFDDAVHVSRTSSGYRLVVAIADVAHYVRPGGPLDREALRRTTSVYFPGTVLPMLPERLSNGICSLNPDVDRLCMVCDLALDREGRPLQADLYEATMRSHARLTYTQVAAALGGNPDPMLLSLNDDLKVAHELSRKLTAQRAQRGSLDFDLPEAKIVLDAEGKPVRMERRPRNDAHRLVEEFMLAANEAVARFFDVRGLPTVYRIHDQPDTEKLESFANLARTHGFELPAGEEMTPQVLNDFLKAVEGKPAQKALNSLLLRAMMQAQYSPENIGHYGLAAPHYLHFTSPIRRYPDLMVHRLLKEHWARGGKPLREHDRGEQEAFLAGVAAQCSDRERAAMKAERDIDAFYAAVYMQDRVGQTFGATVAGVAEFGLFCELDEVMVEGLVPSETLGDGVELDLELHRLRIGRSGRSFGVGDRTEVVVAAVDPARRRITLQLAGKGATGPRWLTEDDLSATSAPKPRPRVQPKGPHGKPPPPRGSPRGPSSRRSGRRGGGR